MTDNQHAPLGLLLLAILSQVHATFAKWSPKDEGSALSEQISRIQRQGEPSSNTAAFKADAIDRGITISRKTFLAVENRAHTTTLTKREYETSKLISPPLAQGSGVEGKGKIKKKEKKREDALSSLFYYLA